jgi:uncharacterized protein (DUF1330 family)
MAAYLIVSETITDPSRFSRYVRSVDPVVVRRGWWRLAHRTSWRMRSRWSGLWC